MRIILTGTPGTGKSSLAPKLAKLIGGRVVDLNDFAKKNKLFLKEKGAFGENVVDLKKMQKKLAAYLKNEDSFVVEGHLACEFKIPADSVIVLRCDPRVLTLRLEQRKYPREKVRENLLAELLDYCLIKASENYGNKIIVQVDATKGALPELVLKKARASKSDDVDWSSQLMDRKNVEFLVGE